MHKLKLIAFDMTQTQEGIPSAEDLRGRLTGEIRPADIDQLVDDLRLFGLPLVRRNLEGQLRSGEIDPLLSFLCGGRLTSTEALLGEILALPEGAAVVESFLKNGSELEAETAAKALGKVGTLLHVPLLKGRLEDSSSAIVQAAGDANGRMSIRCEYLTVHPNALRKSQINLSHRLFGI